MTPYDCAWCGKRDVQDWMVNVGLVPATKAICTECTGDLADRISDAFVKRLTKYMITRRADGGGETGES